MGILVIRFLLAASCVAVGAMVVPGGGFGAIAGAVFAALVIFAEVKLRSIHPNVLMGGIAGSFLGLILALGIGIVARGLDFSVTAEALIQGLAFLVFAYLGIVLGALKGEKGEWWLPWKPWGVSEKVSTGAAPRILDASALIDGRIADVCETGFMDHPLVVPNFVLSQLQGLADSSDDLRRARGRRGLEIVERLRDNADLEVEISERDFPGAEDVDDKLIELAREVEGKIVTGDTSLRQVAAVRDIETLNLNDLGNALKPVFLPGERLEVSIVKPGKEPGQGVGYLDDGTMVVVDSAVDDQGETIEVAVTSVLQTSAGRMIFGKKPHGASPAREKATAGTR